MTKTNVLFSDINELEKESLFLLSKKQVHFARKKYETILSLLEDAIYNRKSTYPQKDIPLFQKKLKKFEEAFESCQHFCL